MTHLRWMLTLTMAVGIALGLIGGQILNAQQEPVKAAILLQTDVVGLPGKEVVVQTADFAPGATSGKHTHPGHEVAYVLAGSTTRYVEGKGWVPAKPGDVFYIPMGVPHDGRNPGTTKAALLSTFVAEQGKPLATPVP